MILFESCIKTNTTIGNLSEEISQLRAVIISYISKHICNDEKWISLSIKNSNIHAHNVNEKFSETAFSSISSISLYSREHAILVWTLNFYLIEMTSTYVPECNLIANTIIAANSVLRKTSSIILFSCIVHGLERVVLTNTMSKFCHDKVERLALDLVKIENEQFSLLALKLLTTCMYMGTSQFMCELVNIFQWFLEYSENNGATKIINNRFNWTTGKYRTM